MCTFSDVHMPSEEDLQADQNEHWFNGHFVCLLSFWHIIFGTENLSCVLKCQCF